MRLFAVAALVATLTACGASAPPPPPTPPSPAIVALAHPPAVVAPKPEVQVIDHKNWSITVPSDWVVSDDSEEGVTVDRQKAPGVVPAHLQVISQPLGDVEPEAFVRIISVMAPNQIPDGVNVTDVKRQAGSYHGRPTSLTQVNTDKGVFLGAFAQVDVANHTGYVVVAIAPNADGKLMATITKSFVIKAAPPPETDDATPPPAPKKTSYEL